MQKTKRTAKQLLGQKVKGYGAIVQVRRTQVQVRTSRGFIWIDRPA